VILPLRTRVLDLSKKENGGDGNSSNHNSGSHAPKELPLRPSVFSMLDDDDDNVFGTIAITSHDDDDNNSTYQQFRLQQEQRRRENKRLQYTR